MRRLLLLIAALGLLAVLVTPAAAGPTPAPPETLAEALRLVKQARGESGDQQERTVAAARQALERDASLGPQLQWLTATLEPGRYDLRRAESQLIAALAVASQPPQSGQDAGKARDQLRGILSAPPFATVSWVDALPEWLRPLGMLALAILERLMEALAWLQAQMFRLFVDFAQTPFALGAALLVVVALVLLYRFALRSAIVREVGPADAPDVSGLTHEAALARAQELFATGLYRDASHFLLASVFLWCDAKGWVRFDATKTNREHLTQLRGQPLLATRLTPLVNRFDRLWYGQDSVSHTEYQDLAAMAASIKEVAA